MLSTGTTPGLSFDRHNVIDFWRVGLASVVTEVTPEESYVGWIRNDPGVWYRHLRTYALMLILKYCMMSMGMPQGELYELTVATIMRSVLTFDITDGIDGTWKSTLLHGQSGCNIIPSVAGLGNTLRSISRQQEVKYPRDLIRKAKRKNQTISVLAFLKANSKQLNNIDYMKCVLKGVQVREPGRFCLYLSKWYSEEEGYWPISNYLQEKEH